MRPGRALLVGATDVDYPAVYRMIDSPDAADLMACVGGALAVKAVIDVSSLTVSYAVESSDQTQVIWTPVVTYIRASTITEQDTAEWLSIGEAERAAAQALIGGVLPSTLEAYAFASEMPLHPQVVAEASTRTASTVDGPTRQGSLGQLVVVAVPEDALPVTETDPEGSVDLELQFLILDDGKVGSLHVGSPGAPSESFGFTLNFDWTRVDPRPTPPQASQVVPFAELKDLSVRREAQDSECTIGTH